MKFKRLTSLLLSTLLAGSLMFTSVQPVHAANASNAIATGIDVSKHNGPINWGAVAASGISFVFIKAGSTNMGLDPYYAANIQGAINAGLKVGVYIYSYATTPEQAQNEANLALAWMANYPVSFPVVIDIEDSCQRSLSSPQLQQIINTFCSTVSAAGYYPMVYSNKNWFNTKIGPTGYDKWVAQYNNNLEYNGASFWQNTSHGSVPGIGTRVDMNYQFKDYSSLIISDGFLDRDGGTRFYQGYKMQRGWINANDTRYHINNAGFVEKNCFFNDENGTYYLQGDGSIARGQVTLGDSNFYFDGNGVRQAGWIALENGKFYYSPETCAMVKGWFSDASGTYYLAPDSGCVLTGQRTIDNQNYYFDANGIRKVGWIALENGKFYYAPDSGAMVKGWFSDASGTYYLAPDSGCVLTGQRTIDNQNYYFDVNGVRQVGWINLENGIFYYAPETGAMVKGWVDDASGRHYTSTKDGHMLVGDVTIEKKNYYFGDDGIMKTGLVQKADKNVYYYDETGAQVVNVPELILGNTLYSINKAGIVTEIGPAPVAVDVVSPTTTPAQ